MQEDVCLYALTHDSSTSQNAEKCAWETASINASLDVYKERTIEENAMNCA